jgi:hypothetical protein
MGNFDDDDGANHANCDNCVGCKRTSFILLLTISNQVNEAAQQSVPVSSSVQPLSDAISAGAVAMFRCFCCRGLLKLRACSHNTLMKREQREVWQQCAVSEDGRFVSRALRWHACCIHQRHVRAKYLDDLNSFWSFRFVSLLFTNVPAQISLQDRERVQYQCGHPPD